MMMSQLNKLTPSRFIFTRAQRAKFTTNGLQVQHDEPNHEFNIELDTHKAFIKYRRSGNVIELEHTEVPEVFRGKGVGKLLALEAFEYVARNNLKMKIHCEYAETIFSSNAEKYKKYLLK